MNIAVILAGGSGIRAKTSVPKQFLAVDNVPIIVYTMMNVQKYADIDQLMVVIPEGWEAFVRAYALEYGITKLRHVIIGGKSRHESISRAVDCLAKEAENDGLVILIDANRPLIPHKVIADAIEKATTADIVVAAEPCYDSMYVSLDGEKIVEHADRNILFKGQMPEVASLDLLKHVYRQATEDGVEEPISALFLRYGLKVACVPGSQLSFKITTSDDIEMFRTIAKVREKNCLNRDNG